MSHLLALLFLIAAAVIDVRTNKIPNKLTFPAILIGLLFTIITNHDAILSTIICIIVFFAMGCIAAAGWGDIKCLMAIATLTGWKTSICTLVLGSLCLIAHRLVKAPKETAMQLHPVFVMATALSGEMASNKRFPFGPYMLFGYIGVLIFEFIKRVI